MKSLLAVLAAVLLTHCGTLINKEFEPVPVTSDPSGAEVTLDCGHGSTQIGTTPMTVMLRRREGRCSITIARSGWIGARVDFHRALSAATLADLALGGAAAAIVASSDVDFSAQNGTSSGGTVSVSASGSGRVPPAAAGAVVVSGALLVDVASGALYSHWPKRVDAVLRPKDSTLPGHKARAPADGETQSPAEVPLVFRRD